MGASLNALRRNRDRCRRGFTLVEMLSATALAMLMLAMLASIMGQVTDSINQNRATMAMRNQLRGVADRLRQDLEGATAPLTPPLDPKGGRGYFEADDAACYIGFRVALWNRVPCSHDSM